MAAELRSICIKKVTNWKTNFLRKTVKTETKVSFVTIESRKWLKQANIPSETRIRQEHWLWFINNKYGNQTYQNPNGT